MITTESSVGLKLLDSSEIGLISGAGMAYELGYYVGYVLGGGAGRDLGIWLYDVTH